MRFKKIFAMLLTGIMIVSMPGAVFAASTEEQIADVQAQKEAAQAELAQQQSDMASLESKKQELESYLEAPDHCPDTAEFYELCDMTDWNSGSGERRTAENPEYPA